MKLCGAAVCLGKIDSRWLMDGGCVRECILQVFIYVNSGVALHVHRRGGVGFGRGGGVVWSLFSLSHRFLSCRHWCSITCSPVSARHKAPCKYTLALNH